MGWRVVGDWGGVPGLGRRSVGRRVVGDVARERVQRATPWLARGPPKAGLTAS